MREKNNTLNMKKQKKSIVSQSTIATAFEEIHTNHNNMNSKMYKNESFAKMRNNRRFTQILNQQCHDYSQFSDDSNYIVNEIGEQNLFSSCQVQQKAQLCFDLENIFFKKKRYCFQILKQFYLFKDQSSSQTIMSIESYDPLIFQDEIIHTLFKILQTKLMENKIWAFLNLKMTPYFKAAEIIEEIATQFHQRRIKILKKKSFDVLKESTKINILPIQPKSHVQKIQTISHEKKLNHVSLNIPSITIQGSYSNTSIIKKKTQTRNNQISSMIISQKVIPKYSSSIKQLEKQTTIFQRSPSISDTNARVIKVNSSQNYYSPSITRVYSSIQEYYRENNKKNVNPSNTTTAKLHNNVIQYNFKQNQQKDDYKSPQFKQPATITYKTSEIISPQKQSYDIKPEKKQNLTKINVIHYYQRPKQATLHSNNRHCHHQQFNSFNSGQMSCHFNNNCQTKIHCCCQKNKSFCCQMRNQPISICCQERCRNCNHSTLEKQSHANTTFFSQKRLNMRSNLSCNKSVQMQELTQLESRIEYLNFLKKMTKQNQNI